MDGVKVFRQNFVTDKLNQMRTKDVHRFTTEINTDKVVVPTDVDISAQPKWDVFENNHFAMRKRLVDIFLKVANKQIIRMRAGKRLAKLKQRFRDLGVISKEDCRRLVAEDWKDSLNVRADGAAGEQENIANVGFKFCFQKSAIQSDIRLPLEYETNIASFMEKIEA